MTQTGDPMENAVAERIHKTVKEEFTNDKQINFSNIDEAKRRSESSLSFIISSDHTEVCNGLHPTKLTSVPVR